MMQTTVWMLAVLLALSSCSRNKTATDVSQETPQIELTDSTDEFTEAPVTDDEIAVDPIVAADAAVEPALEPAAEVAEASPEIVADVSPAPVAMGGDSEYVVQKNETLMMIAFKLYGDYGKWRELSSRNSAVIKNGQLRPGMRLTYALPAVEFKWDPQGNPYLIRTGDTLGGISGQVYGTTRKWKNIWDNNRPLIKDPNRIFAGFTLYWQELGKVAAHRAEI
jgi:nucleoid-associated protein YgaU